ncbi:RNA-directed DNA polymerase from mobile element jockey [Turdus rufiventris]|nr:RNA-directed DNA polymerase from mobile element jockey [Turdus rufiventris]
MVIDVLVVDGQLGSGMSMSTRGPSALSWSRDCDSDPAILWDLLLQLDPYKTMGPDGIDPRILRELLISSQNLSDNFEWCWESGEVPADWKLGNIVLIVKKGKERTLENTAWHSHLSAGHS